MTTKQPYFRKPLGRKTDKEFDLFEKAFTQIAADYAKRNRISYKDFIDKGVPPEILEKAGIAED